VGQSVKDPGKRAVTEDEYDNINIMFQKRLIMNESHMYYYKGILESTHRTRNSIDVCVSLFFSLSLFLSLSVLFLYS